MRVPRRFYTDALQRSPLRPSMSRVLGALATSASELGTILAGKGTGPSIDTLADRGQVSRRTAYRVLAEAEEAGWLDVDHERGRGRTNGYRLVVPVDSEAGRAWARAQQNAADEAHAEALAERDRQRARERKTCHGDTRVGAAAQHEVHTSHALTPTASRTARARGPAGRDGHRQQQQQRKPWRREIPDLVPIVEALDREDRERFEADWPTFVVTRRLRRDVATYLAHRGRRAREKLAEELTCGSYAGAGNAWAVLHHRVRRMLAAAGIDPDSPPEPPAPPDERPSAALTGAEPTTDDRSDLEAMREALDALPAPKLADLARRARLRHGGSLPARPADRLRAVYAELDRERVSA